MEDRNTAPSWRISRSRTLRASASRGPARKTASAGCRPRRTRAPCRPCLRAEQFGTGCARRPAPARAFDQLELRLGVAHAPGARLVGEQRRAGLAPEGRRAVFSRPAGVERVRRAREQSAAARRQRRLIRVADAGSCVCGGDRGVRTMTRRLAATARFGKGAWLKARRQKGSHKS